MFLDQNIARNCLRTRISRFEIAEFGSRNLNFEFDPEHGYLVWNLKLDSQSLDLSLHLHSPASVTPYFPSIL